MTKQNVYIGSCLASKEKLDGLVIENSEVKISNLVIDGLSSPSLKLRKLYGSINFIQSNINIESMKISNSQAEDSVNFINSKVNAQNIQILNSNSDGIDSDFSKLNVNKVYCENIKNDCVDFSFSEGEIKNVISKNVMDKVISTGESSNLKIGYLNIKDVYLESYQKTRLIYK